MPRLVVASLLALMSACTAQPVDDDDDATGTPSGPVDCSAEAWSAGWERVGEGPALEPRGWEGTIIRPTSVVPWDGGFRLYYLAASIEPCGEQDECLARRVGVAQSADGSQWERVGEGPVIDRWEDEVDVSHGVVHRDAGSGTWTYRYGRSEAGRPVGVALATSPDGLEWTVPDDAIELPLGPQGAWDSRFTGGPALVADGSAERMWFTGASDDGAGVGLALREQTGWIRRGAEPVLPPGPSGSYDEASVSNPSVVEVEGCLVMAYKASSFDEPPGDESVGVAVSSDGVAWRRGALPAIERSEDWEADGVVDPALWVADDAVWMAYAALDADFVNTIALARHPIPRGEGR